MTALEKKTVLNEIVTEMHGRENYLITIVSDNMIEEGFPQLYITKLGFDGLGPIRGIWCRIGDIKTDYDDIGCYKCMDKDYMLKNKGYDVCNVKSMKEAVFKIDYVLAIRDPGDDEIFYGMDPHADLDSMFEEMESSCEGHDECDDLESIFPKDASKEIINQKDCD